VHVQGNPEPRETERGDDTLRWAWEASRRRAISAWENVTWEQARDIIAQAYENASGYTAYDWEYSQHVFVDGIQGRILENNPSYGAAMSNVFREQFRLASPQSASLEDISQAWAGQPEPESASAALMEHHLMLLEMDHHYAIGIPEKTTAVDRSFRAWVERDQEKNLEWERG